MANSITFTSAPFLRVTQLTSAGGTAGVTILPADATYDRRIYGITLFTDDAVAKDFAIHVSDGTTTWEWTTISMVASSGNTNSAVPIDVFSHTQTAPYLKNRDASGSLYLNLPKTWSMAVAFNTVIVSAKVVNFTVIGETYA